MGQNQTMDRMIESETRGKAVQLALDLIRAAFRGIDSPNAAKAITLLNLAAVVFHKEVN